MSIKFIDENLLGQPGLSRYIDPKIEWSRDPTDHSIAIYTDSKCFNSQIDPNKKNYAWLIEPPIINGENYINITKNYNKFIKVFSHNLNLASKIDNFVYVPHGGTWLRTEDINIWEKTKDLSMIFSHKQWNSFHRTRHSIYEKYKNSNLIDFYGSGSNKSIEYKIEGLKNYRFSLVIENSIEKDYFTEKILDCLLTATIPIYCGTTNISRYFNTDGIIIFNTIEELDKILNELNLDIYKSKIDAVVDNYTKAHKYIHPEYFINANIQ
ncbi:MAG: hypothetical protein EBR82_40455 [Caulobacteraceae bacterium]|nr:hypothetical protein [Caulobacteraceae bacterium]